MSHLRADAQDNRNRILAAARELFFERGLDVGMREIARKSGLGLATLYRRFPTKQSLINEAYAMELQACGNIIEEGCANRNAWDGFTSVITKVAQLNVQNQGFIDAFVATKPGRGIATGNRDRHLRMLAELALEAQKRGDLRADFELSDIRFVLAIGRDLASLAPVARDRMASRFAALIIDAFRADKAAA